MARVHDVVTLAREATRQIVEGFNTLKSLQSEVAANGGEGWLAGGTEGANADVTYQQVGAAMFTTTDALIDVLDDNGNAHYGNFYRIL